MRVAMLFILITFHAKGVLHSICHTLPALAVSRADWAISAAFYLAASVAFSFAIWAFSER